MVSKCFAKEPKTNVSLGVVAHAFRPAEFIYEVYFYASNEI